jgi:flagellar hook-associated protein 3 FlgL
MTRISENQSSRRLVSTIVNNRESVDRYSNEVSTGIKARDPGDTSLAGTISQLRQNLEKAAGYENVLSTSTSFIEYQDNIMNQMNELLVRLKEVGSQAANETNGAVTRAQMAQEIFQIRDHMVTLANSTYQGRYIYAGAVDNDPPYELLTYTDTPASSAPVSDRWFFDPEPGTASLRSIQLTDDLEMTVNSRGDTLFDDAIQAAETLARAMSGYSTTGTTGAPFTFPADLSLQTQAIRTAIDLADTAREQQIVPERVALGGKLRRIETAQSLLTLSKQNSEDVLGRLQNADEAEAASGLALAQNALQASYRATSQILRLSIMDFI